MAASPQNYRSYTLGKCIVGYGIINGVINALIFFGLHAGDASATFDRSALLFDLGFTGFLLGMILTWAVIPLTKMDMKKGAFTGKDNYGIAEKLPVKAIPQSLIIGVFGLVLAVVLAGLLSFVLPLPLGVMPATIFKGVICAIVGGASGSFTIARTASSYDPSTAPVKEEAHAESKVQTA